MTAMPHGVVDEDRRADVDHRLVGRVDHDLVPTNSTGSLKVSETISGHVRDGRAGRRVGALQHVVRLRRGRAEDDGRQRERERDEPAEEPGHAPPRRRRASSTTTRAVAPSARPTPPSTRASVSGSDVVGAAADDRSGLRRRRRHRVVGGVLVGALGGRQLRCRVRGLLATLLGDVDPVDDRAVGVGLVRGQDQAGAGVGQRAGGHLELLELPVRRSRRRERRSTRPARAPRSAWSRRSRRARAGGRSRRSPSSRAAAWWTRTGGGCPSGGRR